MGRIDDMEGDDGGWMTYFGKRIWQMDGRWMAMEDLMLWSSHGGYGKSCKGLTLATSVSSHDLVDF